MPFEQAPRMGRAVCGSRLPWAAHCEDQAFVGAEMRLSRAAYTWSRACRVGLAICVGGRGGAPITVARETRCDVALDTHGVWKNSLGLFAKNTCCALRN